MTDEQRIAEIRERAKEKIEWRHGERGSEDDDMDTLLSIIDKLTERCEAYKGQVEAGAAEIEGLRRELQSVDSLLARRPAIAHIPDRIGKINHALVTAGKYRLDAATKEDV